VDIDVGAPDWPARSITVLAADSYKAMNSPEAPTNVSPQSKSATSVKADGKQLSLVLPRHSLTVVELHKGD
jgi:alpha-L-arabinofuranosidase